MKNGSSAAWGPGVWPTKKCFWKGRVALIALQIRNKILTTQLYLAHELAFMFTKEACNLWTESYLLLLKINSAVKALCEGEKMPKSRTVAHLGVLHRHDGCWCFLTVLSSPHGCEIFLDAVSAPQSWVLKRKQGWEGTISGLETQDKSCRIHSNDRAERKTAKENFACSLCHEAGIAQQAKTEEAGIAQQAKTEEYLWLFFLSFAKDKKNKNSLYAVARNLLVKQVSWSCKQLIQQKANQVAKAR